MLAANHKELGVRYGNVAMHQHAITELKFAQSLTPDDKDIYYLLASSYFALRKFAQAHNYYSKCNSGPYAQVSKNGMENAKREMNKLAKKRGSTPEQDVPADSIEENDIGLPNRTTINSLK